jgi:uncharacterized protein YdaU (DUF1376 family)
MHYFTRNIGDYHKKAGRLSMLEHGAYTLLIDACYDRERFPTKDEAIDWCWARTDAEIAAVEFVLGKFFDCVDGFYVQNRIKEEIEKYHEKVKTNKRIATEREEKRRERARSVHEASPEEHEAPPNHKPITNNQEPLTKNQGKPCCLDNADTPAQDPAPAPKPKTVARGSRLPSDWKPTPEDLNYCREKRPDLDPHEVAESFRDFWVSKTGPNATKLDWSATWRNWVRNQKQAPHSRSTGDQHAIAGTMAWLTRNQGESK